MVVMQARQRAVYVVEFNFRRAQIDPLHTLGAAGDTGQHLTERGCCCVWIYGGSSDIREERMKYHVVFATEEKNVALGCAQLAAKSLCELYGGESSTDNDYSYWVHSLAPIAAWVRLKISSSHGLLF
jgi:hypothetical protein